MRYFKLAILCGLISAIPFKASGEGQIWAVAVGVDDYVRESIPDLRFACADAKLFSQALTDLLQVPKDHLFVFSSDAVDPGLTPTRLNLVYRLDWLSKHTRKGDKVLFFFAGHGANLDSESFLLTEESDTRSMETLKASALGTKDLSALLQRTPASQTLTIIDACRNDPGGKHQTAAGVDERMPQLFLVGPDQECAGLFSCSVGQRSWEWDAKKHGFFTYFLVEGMRGSAAGPDGRVSLQSLSEYLAKDVPAATQSVVHEAQVPRILYAGTSTQNWTVSLPPASSRALQANQLVPRLDANAAQQDLLTAQRVEFEARLGIEETRRHEAESRLEALEKQMQTQGSGSEEVQKLALSRDMALKELLETRRKLEESQAQLAARGGPTAEAELMLAEREQLKAENKVLQAKIAILEGRLQQGGLSMARSFRLETDPVAEAQAVEEEKLASQKSDPSTLKAAYQSRIRVLLGQSRQLRERAVELTRLSLSKSDALHLQPDNELSKRELDSDLEMIRSLQAVFDNRFEQARLAQRVAALRISANEMLLTNPEAEAVTDSLFNVIEDYRKQLAVLRQAGRKVADAWVVGNKNPRFNRRVTTLFGRHMEQINGPAGWGDILEVPVTLPPELQDLP